MANKLDVLEKQLEAALAAAAREAASCAFLAPVADFLARSAAWPRAVLEAFVADATGDPYPGNAPHVHLRRLAAYALQGKAYADAGRPQPDRVRARWRALAAKRFGATDEARAAARRADPRPDEWVVPPAARVRMVDGAENPRQRGDGVAVAGLVAAAGPAGISFAALHQLATALLDGDLAAARAHALRCFAEYVDDGHMKIVFDFGNPAPAPSV